MDLRRIAQKIERETCHVYHEHPKATPTNDSINLSCCCDQFKEKLVPKIQDEISKQISDDISKAFR